MPKKQKKSKKQVLVTLKTKKRKNVKKQGRVSKESFPGQVGRALGGLISPAMSNVGSTVGNYAAKIFGMGSYSIRENSLLPGSTGPPVFNGDGSITISHREYIKDLYGSSSFKSDVYRINPTNSNLFPWLSNIAGQFEKYKFEGLVMEFKSTSADALNSTNTALGTVVLVTEYDISKAPFVDKREMEMYEYSNSTKPSESVLHYVECAPELSIIPTKFTWANGESGNPSGTDPHLYDVGSFQVGTVGMQATANIGELWVSYKIRLITPRVAPAQDTGKAYAHLTSLATSSTGWSLSRPYGTADWSYFDGTMSGANPPTVYSSISRKHWSIGFQPVSSANDLLYFSNYSTAKRKCLVMVATTVNTPLAGGGTPYSVSSSSGVSFDGCFPLATGAAPSGAATFFTQGNSGGWLYMKMCTFDAAVVGSPPATLNLLIGSMAATAVTSTAMSHMIYVLEVPNAFSLPPVADIDTMLQWFRLQNITLPSSLPLLGGGYSMVNQP